MNTYLLKRVFVYNIYVSIIMYYTSLSIYV